MNDDNRIINNFNNIPDNAPAEPYRVVQNNNITTNNSINYSSNNQSSNLDYQSNQVNVLPEVNNVQNNNMINNVNNNTYQLHDTSSNINDRPIQKQKKKATIKINPELKTAVLLMVVLLVCMAFIPTIFDWLNDLKIKIFG